MKKNVLLVVMVLIVGSSFSQINTFSKTYSQFYTDIRGKSITKAQENSFIVVGNKSQKGFIANIDSIGNFVWQYYYEAPNGAFSFKDITPTSDSCYMVTGNSPIVCMKINTFGDTLWCKAFSAGNFQDGISIEETFDHGFIISGWHDNIGYPLCSMVTIKLDSVGNQEWRKAMTFGDFFNLPISVRQLPDSTYIILASVGEEIYSNYRNAVLINLSQSGDILWSKQYYRSTTEKFAGVDLLIIPTGIISYTADDDHIAIMKTDFAGNVLWGKRYSSLVINNCCGCGSSKINPVSDGGYILTNGQPEPTSNYERKILKLDSTFNILWSKEVVSNPIEIFETNDQGLLLFHGPPEYAQDLPYFGILKMNSFGWADSCLTSSLDTVFDISIISNDINPITIDSSSVSNFFINPLIYNSMIEVNNGCMNYGQTWGINETTTSEISIYPNPSNGSITISTVKYSILEVSFFTQTGQKILTIKSPNNSIDISNLKPGLYFAEIKTNEGNVMKKIIIQ